MASLASKRITSGLLRMRMPRQYTAYPASYSPFRQYSSDEAPPPPLLQKLKADLKVAMRAKDAARLTVLRSVLAATLNASKTATPIQTDAQLIALLRKTQRGNEEAVSEAKAAKRDDLIEKEEAQIRILEEYVAGSGVEEVTDDQLRTIVAGVVTAMTSEGAASKPKMGDVMKTLLAPGGPLDGKMVEKAQVARIVKEVAA